MALSANKLAKSPKVENKVFLPSSSSNLNNDFNIIASASKASREAIAFNATKLRYNIHILYYHS